MIGSDGPAAVLHPVVREAAAGRLPPWAQAGAARVDHMRRVAALMEAWAAGSGLAERDVARWRAAGMLHDVLREADPSGLVDRVAPHLRSLPPSLLHGPAAETRLRGVGVDDEALLEAVAYHTVGHAAMGRLGRALYIADFLEPGRTFEPEWRAGLRARMPEEADAVLPVVVAARIRHLIDRGSAVHPESLAFWNGLVEEGNP